MPVDPFAMDVFVVDYIGTVDSVNFVETEFGNIQAVFHNRFDEAVVGDDGETRTERVEFVSVGNVKEWQVAANGTAFEHTSLDPDKRVRPQSAYGQLLQRAQELCGRDDLLGEKEDYNYGLHSQDAWVGKRFHWVTEGAGETIKLKDRDTGKPKTIVSKGHQMPVEYLAEGQPLDPITGDYYVEGLGLDDGMVADLTTMAKGLTFGEFQSRGISLLNDLQGDDRRGMLAEALNVPSFYETLKRS